MRIAIDAMGGDFGPQPIVEGVVKALEEKDFTAYLVGDEKQIKPLIPNKLLDKVRFINSEDFIRMDESATEALKRKESTIYKSIELLRNKEVDAVVSAGHSGATMSLATLRIGRIKGIRRPAIITFMPTIKKQYAFLLDAGANVDCDAHNLYQFGLMGEVYAKVVLNKDDVKLGLLSNGEEESKGNTVTKEAFGMLKESFPNFVGNVEGGDIFKGEVDVIITDGFIGNIVLKTSEGAADVISKLIKEEIKNSGLLQKIGALLLKPVFKGLKKAIDYAEYGGAPLLGINGCVIIAHGKSNSKAIKNAIFQAIRYVENDVTNRIKESLKVH
ncbi:phosphate acyltransferase PlsX [Caminibacter pacificus]|uniref:Phosphate acyltransferase n=1 Tax=Caminibacter pacificus TaxID=1424653 RepID=A0AAJ4UXV6_9BACT|nr:phosphate acyltransferase PlsX [Caminibacter pacificus]QCI27801.1 phosphate acyltransferase PlsX [Caminibacter pacificus]ROR40024.1 phosphate:acyl-[acyl carrier protein] acyltransferase [Caminibacter pacificus]